MMEIGGFLSLELDNNGKPYHSKGIELNSGRNCLKLILKERRVNHLYIPYYTCESVVDVCKETVAKVSFYTINDNLELDEDFKALSGATVLLTNYFGIKGDYISDVVQRFGRVIVDNSQGFYDKPLNNVDTFYSPRKFFGIADGGYLMTALSISTEFSRGKSYNRMSHLLKRIDLGAQHSYGDFIENDESIIDEPIALMSKLTQAILGGVNYSSVARKRRRNYNILHESLKKFNVFRAETNDDVVPLIYPFRTKVKGLREFLISKKIYVAKYWPNMNLWTPVNSNQINIANEIIALPIDQRYATKEMQYVVEVILEFIGNE